jgi:hypothetical protein
LDSFDNYREAMVWSRVLVARMAFLTMVFFAVVIFVMVVKITFAASGSGNAPNY